MENTKILLYNIHQIVQVVDTKDTECLIGEQMKNIKLKEEIENIQEKNRINCNGGCILPGLVDAHTHPVFDGDRVHEFAMKLAGATYMEIQEAGGGINFSAEKTRKATEETLLNNFHKISKEMLNSGTTLIEAKSGYGLEMETELKMLSVLNKANHSGPLEISATFCGAHAIPKGSNEQTQTHLIVNEIIPALKNKLSSDFQNLENIDVFCEKNARAASHLEEISENGIKALKEAGTVAILLPTTAFILRLKSPPARKLIEAGVCVALGSDFNPNAYCLSMPTVMHLACIQFRLSMAEALVAATINAAHSINRGKSHGAITVGRVADFVVLNTNNWEHLIYRLGCHQMIISHVIKNGKIVYQK